MTKTKTKTNNQKTLRFWNPYANEYMCFHR